MNHASAIKLTITGIASIVISFLGAYAYILACVLFAICFDVITGLIASKIKGKPINSNTGAIGFWKKVSLLLVLFFGIFLDVFIPLLFGVVSINIPFKLPIGTIIGCYICLNECISILENLNRCNNKILPSWIRSLLTGAKNTIDTGGNNNVIGGNNSKRGTNGK